MATFWVESEPKLRKATAKQLSHLGWAVLVGLQARPPRSWSSTYVSALNKALGGKGGPAGGPAGGAATPGGLSAQAQQQVLPQHIAQCAADALAALRVPDLDAWCLRLGVPMPEEAAAGADWGREGTQEGDSSAGLDGEGRPRLFGGRGAISDSQAPQSAWPRVLPGGAGVGEDGLQWPSSPLPAAGARGQGVVQVPPRSQGFRSPADAEPMPESMRSYSEEDLLALARRGNDYE